MSKTSNNNVYLGFANPLDKNELFSLKRQYLPLGKVGGFPAWLNPTNLPQVKQLACLVKNFITLFIYKFNLSYVKNRLFFFYKFIVQVSPAHYMLFIDTCLFLFVVMRIVQK